MQPSLVPFPATWADRALTLVIGLVGGGTIYKLLQLIVNKAKRKSDVAVTNAQAENLKVDAFAKYQDLLMRVQDQLNLVEARADEQERNCQQQIQFFQTSTVYQRQMLSTYIKRGHAFCAEWHKCVMSIEESKIKLAVAAEKLKGSENGIADNGTLIDVIMLITPMDLTMESKDSIEKRFPLPKPPDGVEPLVDSGEFQRPA